MVCGQWYRTSPVPSDGLVVSLNDIEYGSVLGVTASSPRDSIAFKWQDETAETTLRGDRVVRFPHRTHQPGSHLRSRGAGRDYRIQSFGTQYFRNEGTEAGIGDRISVYKANMIIPQIAEKPDRFFKTLRYPEHARYAEAILS